MVLVGFPLADEVGFWQEMLDLHGFAGVAAGFLGGWQVGANDTRDFWQPTRWVQGLHGVRKELAEAV